MNELKIKRAYLPAEKNDGRRILIDRLWPRGLSKAKAQIDEWNKEIAPSTELRKWFSHDVKLFDVFSQRYKGELDVNAEARTFARQLVEWLEEGDVTLLYGAKDEEHNNAVVFKEWFNQLSR